MSHRTAVAAMLVMLLSATDRHVCAGAGSAPIEAGPAFVDRLIDVERASGTPCSPPEGSADTRELVADMTVRLRGRIGAGHGPEAVHAMNRFVFEDLKFRPSRDVHDPANLCLASVISRREGYCVGLACLYVVLAEGVGLPIHAVATPTHVFLRYDDGTTRINIETFRQGAEVPDAEYTRDEKIPAESVARGVFLSNLSREGLLAQVYNNLGVIYSERGETDRATAAYEQAIALDRNFPAAWYNWGSDLLRENQDREAVKRFARALDLHRTDIWALNNRGVAYRHLGKAKKARRDFESALQIDPTFERAKENLALLDGR